MARSAGLDVLLAPLMVLEHAALVPDLPLPDANVRILDPSSPAFPAELSASRAVAHLGFGNPPSAMVTGGVAGPAERDAAPPLSEAMIKAQTQRYASGRFTGAVAESPTEGILASGMVQQVRDVAEIVGVATLPSARGRGYASQLTAALARHALENGADLVFLSAGDDDVARLYAKVGFRRIGTACIAQPAAATI